MKTSIAVLSLFMAVGHAVAWAEGLAITPGMWETTTTTENSVTGNRTDTRKDCVKESVLDPSSQMQGMPKDQCQVKTKVDGNTINYDMVCTPPQGVKMNFTGSVTVDGDRMQGSMQMEGAMAGQAMTMSMKSTGKRLGDC
ncbi:MAG: DUF3617 domain-containing protein [Pseudomonadales bacterium]